MADENPNTHGPGEDVIDPSAPFLGWLGLGLIGLMAVVVAFVLIAGASAG
jgi:hypothetical protein